MFKRCLLVIRDIEEANVLLRFLEELQFKGELILTTLDVAYIPVAEIVVSLKHPEWINECLSLHYKNMTNIKIRVIEYDGTLTPAEALTNLIKEEKCELVLIVRKSLIKGVGNDLSLSLAGLSPVPVVVVPYVGS